MAGYTVNVWQDIEIRVDTYPLCTLCQIFKINKKSISKTPLNPKKNFKWVFMDIILAIYSKSLTKYATFANEILIEDAYFKIQKIYGMENIITEEFMDQLDMF